MCARLPGAGADWIPVNTEMKKIIAIALALTLLLGCTACGRSVGRSGGVRPVTTLVQQDYSLAFRVGDPTRDYIDAALKVLTAEGRVDELATKWFGERIISFERDPSAMDELEIPGPRDLIIGVDVNSFPMAYLANGEFWGFDVELAMAVADRLGWNLKIQTIEKEDVYIELSSGNIDCAWGGIALNDKEVADGLYSEYGPYVHNDIVIAARGGSFIYNKMMLAGKSMAMCTTAEALAALDSEPHLGRRLGQITRLAGGTTECFSYLFSGKCDVVLTDTMAIYYFNCH